MAYDIGPKIGIDGEKEYRAQINSIITQTKTLQAETKKVSAAYDDNTSAQVKAANQTKALAREIELQKSKLDTQRTMLAKAKEAHGENSAQAQKWQRVVAESEAELARLNAELQRTPSQLQAFGQDMQAAGKKVEAVGKAVSKVGATLTKAVTAPVVALGTAAVKTTADFDASMSKVSAVSGATGSQFEALRAKAREMGAQTKFSASEAADAMNYMAMAGWKTEDMLSGVEGIMSLAAASGEDLATTSDIVTDALTAFGKSAKDSGRLADILAAASSNANTNVSMMGETFKYAAPVAGALGISMEDTAVAVGLMANAGIKASNAGTALRTGLSKLVGPTKQSKEAMEKYNIAVKTNNDGSVNLRETMQSLREKMSKLSETEQTAAAKAIFGANAYAGWLAVINGSEDDFDKLTSAIDNSSGTAKRMAEIMQNNLSGQITILKSQVQELGISFGDILIPHVRKAVNMVQDAVEAFNSLDESEKEQIVKLAAIAAAAGPVLTIGGKLISTTGALITTGGQLITLLSGAGAAAEAGAAGVGLLGGAMAALPVVGAIAGIAALAAIVYKLSKNADKSGESVTNLSVEMSELSKKSETTRKALGKVVSSVDSLAESNKESIAKTDAAAKLAERYAEELKKLAEKTTRTTGEQAKMSVLVQKLNGIYPDLALEINATTGNLNMSTDALEKNIEQMKIQAKVMVYQKIMEEQLSKIADVETKVLEAEMKQSEALEKSAQAADRKTQITNALKAEQEELEEATKALNEVQQKNGATAEEIAAAEMRLQEASTAVYDGLVNLNGVMVDSTQAMTDAADAQRAADEEVSKWNQSIAESTEAEGKLEEMYEAASKRADEYSKELDKSTVAQNGAADSADGLTTALSAAGDAAGEAAGEIDEASEEIVNAWKKTYDSARESVMSQGNIFDELSEKATTSIDTMRANLEKQIESYRSWNENATFLMSSTEYATDENFRNMVNYIISAGQSMSPELQAIVDAFRNGDTSLAEITSDYGEMSKLADDVATTTANATTAAEFGLAAMQEAFSAGAESSAGAITTGNASIKTALDTGAGNIKLGVNESLINYDKLQKGIAASGGLAAKAASDESHAISKGMKAGIPALTSATNEITKTTGELPNKVKSYTGASLEAGKAVVISGKTGIESQKASFSQTAKSTGTTAQEFHRAIAAQKGRSVSVSKDIGNSAAAAIASTKSNVVTQAKDVGSQAGQVATASNAQKNTVAQSGKAIGKAYSDAVLGMKGTATSNAHTLGYQGREVGVWSDKQKDAVKNAGIRLGQAYADGVYNRRGAALSSGKSVANAGKDGINSVSTYSAKEWGHHLGQNLADGIWDKYDAVKRAAEALAKAAAGPLEHSTPKEGPLMHDDVWGMHLAENFASAMRKGRSIVRDEAMGLAAEANVPAYVDPCAVSGRGSLSETIQHSINVSQLGGLDPEMIYEAVRAGAESITLQVGDRELGRVLRDMGVVFA